MKLLARLLIAIGLTCVALGRKLDRPEPPAAKLTITLPARHYRPARPRRRFSFNWLVYAPVATG
jgi:hypothetical protein